MRKHHHANQARTAFITILSLLISLTGLTGLTGLLAAQIPLPPPPQGATPVKLAQAPAPPQPVDGGWPRAYETPGGGRILLYQPQVASWEDQQRLTAYAAVSCLAQGADKPALGTIKIETKTKVSTTERLVNFTPLKITEANFSTLPKERIREITDEITKAIPEEDKIIALDRVIAYVDLSQIVPKNMEGLKADPPTIFFSQHPAVLVNFDGQPIWSPIEGNDLKFAVNTNWDLFQHTPTYTYYLRNRETWLKSSSLTGRWEPAGQLPESFKKLPADDNWKEVRASLPGKHLSAAQTPTVFVSFQPAELILLQGEPDYVPVRDSDLLWVRNTESDVFRLKKDGPIYYLVTGRWFSAMQFTGPWIFTTPNLPKDFKKIPLEHARSRVLASVPGTPQAAEAVLLAQIPQTARINKKELKAPQVVYQGDPQFEPIEQTTVERAVNTDKDIIKVGDLYYMCYQGVWFMARSATGPWEVTSSVPKEIYAIPASSPSHHVTYVIVEQDEENADWETAVAVAGYTGTMVAWGCAVWGSGWYYPPYYWYGGYYPIYYPGFPTYGYSAWYNPHTGAYGRNAWAYGPYGGAGVGARYNPSTGTYARGAAVYGPSGARGVAEAFNPRTGTYAATRQASNVYGSWGSTYVQRGDQWAQTRRYTNRQTGTTTRTIRTEQGGLVRKSGPEGSGFIGKSGDNVYAGRDGNVYRRDGSGNWQKYENGGWNNVGKPDSPGATPKQQAGAAAGQLDGQGKQIDHSTYKQLESDRSARMNGAERTRDVGDYRSGSSKANTGSYRTGSGRGMRGGGRRR